MSHVRLTPCDCGEIHYRLLPRHWWMRMFSSRRRYRCKTCGATMLLRRASSRRLRARNVLLIVFGLVVAGWASFYAVGYHEAWADASWRRWVENQ